MHLQYSSKFSPPFRVGVKRKFQTELQIFASLEDSGQNDNQTTPIMPQNALFNSRIAHYTSCFKELHYIVLTPLPHSIPTNLY